MTLRRGSCDVLLEINEINGGTEQVLPGKAMECKEPKVAPPGTRWHRLQNAQEPPSNKVLLRVFSTGTFNTIPQIDHPQRH